MKLYIWASGEVSNSPKRNKSDDFFTVDTDNWEELESKVNNHFGDTTQAVHVIIECEEWQDIDD